MKNHDTCYICSSPAMNNLSYNLTKKEILEIKNYDIRRKLLFCCDKENNNICEYCYMAIKELKFNGDNSKIEIVMRMMVKATI